MSTDDESFHPLGHEWEGELEEMLDETEYDSELGMEMAQDAMRVTKGELSEAEFHEMYHDDVMEEFGVDDRPTEAAYEQAQEEQKGTATRMLEAFEGDGEESRREAMKKMGVGAAAVGLGAWGTVDDGPEADLAAANDGEDHSHEGTQLGMVIDLERCDGCLSCVTACQEENQTDQGVNWMYVLDYREPGQGADPDERGGSRQRLVRPCQHCTDAPCEKVCPTTARHTRDKDGLVLTDYDVCIGCRYCQVACPYGVNYFQWDEPDVSTDEIEEMYSDMDGDHMVDDRDRWVDSRAPRGTMSKCTMCPTRQDGHMGDEYRGTTACEEACPPEAINFGDMNDPDSKPQRYLQNVVQTRAERMVDGQSPNRENVQESYDFLEGDIELLDMEYLEDGDHDEIEAALFIQGELDEDDLTLEDEELRDVIIDILEDDDELGELEEDELESLADALIDGDDSVDNYDTALDAIDAVITTAEDGIQDVVDRYESREITPAEVEESLLILDGEEEPWVSEQGITDEETAQQALEAYAGGEASTFKLLEDIGTSPNVTYVGNEPGPEAEQVDGPVAYDDIGQTDNRKDVLDESTVGDFGVSL
ncbi:4Fe-4S ferredoxin N-terminal domain-containing protein [Natronorubrum bangense]|uniref:4Fe-4S ferredoxin n=2 Tax=Natronorubrum bangense TaxID=61858 RepID=L9W3W1_9EURY|nr:4Fe-4S ferredoxin N-terminal domain-containing protein [Natronorubrum bangense]ELY44179.1 4Fe-4S ferredoxin [Natronorubrum bangense JCM 10635]QCC55671.1 4Fe-4S dicluster domain-containing protein [Natronorubrum bangense]